MIVFITNPFSIVMVKTNRLLECNWEVPSKNGVDIWLWKQLMLTSKTGYVNKPLLIFVTGMEKFIESIPQELKDNYFNKIQELHNCYFIVTEKIDLMKSYLIETWYKNFSSTDNSIFIGKGLNNSLIHTNLSTPLRQISIPIPDNYAYNIKSNNAIKIKIVEGE